MEDAGSSCVAGVGTARGRVSQGALSGYRMSMQNGRSGSCNVATAAPDLPSQYLIVLSHDDVTIMLISDTQKMFLIGASCAATCVWLLDARSHTLAVLSQLPVKTRAPSELQAAQSTGPSCEVAALGTA